MEYFVSIVRVIILLFVLIFGSILVIWFVLWLKKVVCEVMCKCCVEYMVRENLIKGFFMVVCVMFMICKFIKRLSFDVVILL